MGKKLSGTIKDLYSWALLSEGSSRTSSLIRIGLVLIIWSRWGNEVTFFNSDTVTEYILSILFYIFTPLMLIGFYSNITTFLTSVITFTMYYYFGFYLGIEAWTHHHTYLLAMSTFLCSFTPCGNSYSLDRYLKLKQTIKRNLPAPDEKGNLFGLRLISLQVCAMYFWTAFDKSNIPWITGEKMEANLMYMYTGSYLPEFTGFKTLIILVSITVLILEYALSFGLIFRNTRKFLIIPGILFHFILYLTLPVKTFSATVILLYLSFMDTESVHKFIEFINGHTSSAGKTN